MRLSKFTCLLLILIIGLSVFLAKVSNLIRVSYDDFEAFDEAHGGPNQKVTPHPDPSTFVIGDSAEPLLWFLQVILELFKISTYSYL